ncbi:hypothetical protein DINM_005404 [Dirofilaria immitis]|nr:hypothetical protein [Dirofilaria immitis]
MNLTSSSATDRASLYSQEEAPPPSAAIASTSAISSDSPSAAPTTSSLPSSDSKHIKCAINLAAITNQQAVATSAKMYSLQHQTALQPNGTATNTRSQSRSTEGSGSGGLTPSNSSQQSVSTQPTQQTQQMPTMGQLGVALQQATGIEAPPTSFTFNNSDLFSSFPTNHNLLQYQMRPELMGLSGFRTTNGSSMNTVRFIL